MSPDSVLPGNLLLLFSDAFAYRIFVQAHVGDDEAVCPESYPLELLLQASNVPQWKSRPWLGCAAWRSTSHTCRGGVHSHVNVIPSSRVNRSLGTQLLCRPGCLDSQPGSFGNDRQLSKKQTMTVTT